MYYGLQETKLRQMKRIEEQAGAELGQAEVMLELVDEVLAEA